MRVSLFYYLASYAKIKGLDGSSYLFWINFLKANEPNHIEAAQVTMAGLVAM